MTETVRLGSAEWARVRTTVAGWMGLSFPEDRLCELQRGFAAAARELELDDAETLARQLLRERPSSSQLAALAQHLTVGETYFFRDAQLMKALAAHVLPCLIDKRRGRNQRLRIWSAACASGEEAYTLAILVHRLLLPDLPDWDVRILGTDINPAALQKANAGVYGAWSFRDSPPWLRASYFDAAAGRHSVAPRIRGWVTFRQTNLVEDEWPDTQDLDLILCRNVLMYFDPVQAGIVIDRLHASLCKDGWLALGACEFSLASHAGLAAVHFPGSMIHRKCDGPDGERLPVASHSGHWTRPPEAPVQRSQLEPAQVALASASVGCRREPVRPSAIARTLADQGRLAEALAVCETWVGSDKLDPEAHFLSALILMEQQRHDEARASLSRALLLDPAHAPAHRAMGELARHRGDRARSDRHFATALGLSRAGAA